MKNEHRKNPGIYLIFLAGIIFWYNVAMLFIDIRTWGACIAGIITSILSIYPKVPNINDATFGKKLLASYIVGVVVAILVNILLNVGTALLIVSSIVMVAIAPIIFYFYAEVME